MNWDDMKIFLAIAKAKGLKKAANSLRMHHTSCARRIKSFEKELGLKLFDRLPGGYVLTQAGETLLQSAYKIQEEFNTVELEMLGKDLRLEGDICVTLPNGFGTHLLMPDIHDFMELYPEVNVKVNMTYSRRDLASREADVAIRHVNNPEESLSGKRVARVYYSAYASIEYLNSHDPINDPESCHWLGWGDAANHLKWAEKSKYPKIPVRGDLYSDILQLAAIKGGMGIASLPCFITDNEPEVRRIPMAKAVPADWIWVLAHKDMMSNAKVRALIDFLAARFEKHHALLEGKQYAYTD